MTAIPFPSRILTTSLVLGVFVCALGCRPESSRVSTPVKTVDDVKIHVGPAETEQKTAEKEDAA